MAIDQRKYEHKHDAMLRDVRPLSTRISDGLQKPNYSTAIFALAAMSIYVNEWALTFADLILFCMFFYFLWLVSRDRSLSFKLPMGSKHKDANNGRDGKKGKPEGILYLGNGKKTNEEVWFTNSDIRTHILYLGTTGAGKTEGLKSLVTNAMTWGSGFVYVDGKADTDLWSSLSSLVRRFGRDDDLLVLNYMTGNADVQAPSNSMNPFSSGSASYLTNMLVSLMPESGGDNAMWKERAVSLVGAMMPALTWKRDNQEVPLSVRTIRDYLSLNNVIKLARDEAVPKEIREGLIGYLETLPGFIGEAYDDEGKVKPPGPDTPQYNTETASQQHGYLAMQFTRSLQSLGDDYGYIFDTQAADVDMVDVVLNRRILVVLVPALEKSGDEVANLGKIVSASIKGMMGSTLGSTVEGDSASVIENKPTHSSTPFMTVFDEVGYYVAEGMAVMAAQARSLGFSLVFAGQDLPAMKKRVREEANSITANCNIKLFGKLEDPTETKEFFEKTVGSAMVTEVSGFQMSGAGELGAYHDTRQAGVQLRPRANYDQLRGYKEGQAIITFGETVVDCAVFYSNPGFAKAMRVTRYMALPPPDDTLIKHANAITKLRDLMVNKTWTAMRADVALETSDELAALNEGFTQNNRPEVDPVFAGIASLVKIHSLSGEIPAPTEEAQSQTTQTAASPQQPTQPPQNLAATRPADIASTTAATAATVATATTAAAAGTTGKPSIFGAAPKPDQTIETSSESTTTTATTTQTPPTETSSEKPAVFGGDTAATATPAEPTQPAQPAQTTPLADEEKLAKAAENVKDSLFKQQSETPPAPDGNSEASNAKPTIFGGGTPATPATTEQPPATPTEPVEPAQTTPLADEEKLSNAAEGIKDSLFKQPQQSTTTETPAESKSAENNVTKPTVFGGDAPAIPATEQPSEPAQPEQTTPKVDETSETSEVKPAVFGGNDAPTKPAEETAATQPQQSESAPPTGQTEQPPAEETKKPEKPAIFGAKPEDKSDSSDDNS